jgi:hypothetical protein
LQCKLPRDDPRMDMDEGAYFNFVRTGSADEESFQQKFCCTPADDNTAFLPYDLIAGCEYRHSEAWQTDLVDCKNPLFVGVDVGREHDLTVIWLLEQVNDINFTRRVGGGYPLPEDYPAGSTARIYTTHTSARSKDRVLRDLIAAIACRSEGVRRQI